ncbi:ribosomal protein S4 [Orientia chuto str. Dubai]|uniref:Small ribosomal subunit protein uS4 n=1 Tax=Orientia chuto str. Dubai TaxID=1359168 RepID=A0A0F3MKE3_9RICK|nr:30S ribosomal protein S4 [Candidatus Orientia mediorientalis]KJV55947.1 ribosomal protein S4 [Orientia chuto str. Dubai]
MTKVIKSKYKVSRRLGISVWGHQKDAINKKNYKPGQQGNSTSISKRSDYSKHLIAKQRLKSHYGRISEKQFRNTFKLAQEKRGNTAENLVALLERRLDAVVYRLNIAPTIFAARQLVSHKHIMVNGKKINIASYKVKAGDSIQISESAKQIPIIIGSVSTKGRKVPEYLSFDDERLTGSFIRMPSSIDEVPYPFDPKINLVVEFYSA